MRKCIGIKDLSIDTTHTSLPLPFYSTFKETVARDFLCLSVPWERGSWLRRSHRRHTAAWSPSPHSGRTWAALFRQAGAFTSDMKQQAYFWTNKPMFRIHLRIRIGSGLNEVSGFGSVSGSRRAKMTTKIENKVKKIYVLTTFPRTKETFPSFHRNLSPSSDRNLSSSFDRNICSSFDRNFSLFH